MDKQAKIIRLYDMFLTHPVVSMKAIMHELDIPKRTAFRYITNLKDAGIDICYSKQERGYQIEGRKSKPVAGELSVHQILMVVIALNLAKNQVNDVYRKHIDEVLHKLSSRLPHTVEDSMTWLKIEEPSILSSDQSSTYTKLLVEAAIMMERSIDASYSTKKELLEQTFKQPSLLFRGDWHIRDNQQRKVQIPIDLVQTVRIR